MRDTIIRIHGADGVGTVFSLLADSIRASGAHGFAYQFTPAFKRLAAADAVASASADDDRWVSLRENGSGTPCPPVPQFVMRGGMHPGWSDLLEGDELRSDAQAFSRQLREGGLVHGYGIPLFGPDSREAYLAIGYEKPRPEHDEEAIILAAVAQIAHLKICAMTSTDRTLPKLSEREREVLGWVARGKSNSDIAAIVGVSPETVKTHLQRIFAKLEVSDRVGASVKALKLSLIRV